MNWPKKWIEIVRKHREQGRHPGETLDSLFSVGALKVPKKKDFKKGI